jgi:UDPglucose--hexose-1-phosphate uridylyltransferase
MSGSAELRQNVLTGRWIAVAPNRGDWQRARYEHTEPFANSCPFCPGHEEELAPLLVEVKAGGDPGWRIRVVPNRYPAFTNDPFRGEWVEPHLTDGGGLLAGGLTLGSDVPVRSVAPLPAVGYQEVIIETPDHDRDIPDMTPEELTEVISVYHARYLSVSESAPSCRVFLFRNRGPAAGMSIAHPHGQLVATTAIPPEVRVREIRMLAYQNDHGRCLVCSLPELEPEWADRLVLQNDDFFAFVPWAAESECEVWIVPRRHQAEFGEISPAEQRSLAETLIELLARLRDRAGNPAYNLMIHSPRRSRSGSQAFHWFVQIRPRTAQNAGFEMASGISINGSLPERDAGLLRGDARAL